MAVVYYSQQDEYDLVNSGQDCMGWTVTDQAGNKMGEVTEMLINTDTDVVDSILIDRKKRIPAADFALRDKQVVVRGVMHDGELVTEEKTTTTETHSAPMSRTANARNVAGVTREANDDEVSIPIIEEQLNVGKRTVESGGARVRTTMTEKPVEEKVTLREENVTVERHKVDRAVDTNMGDAFKEGSFEVTTQAEVPVVSKEARVVEEVVIDKQMIERTETVRDSVKRTDVEVDEINTGDAANRKND